VSEQAAAVWEVGSKFLPYVALIQGIGRLLGGEPAPSPCQLIAAFRAAVRAAAEDDTYPTLGAVRKWADDWLRRWLGSPVSRTCGGVFAYATSGGASSGYLAYLEVNGKKYQPWDGALRTAMRVLVAAHARDVGGPDYTGVVNDPSLSDDVMTPPYVHLTTSGGMTLDADDPGQVSQTFWASDVAQAAGLGVRPRTAGEGGGVDVPVSAASPWLVVLAAGALTWWLVR